MLHFIRTPELVNIQLVELYPKTEDVGTTSNHLLPIGPRSGVIYSWLFKYTQQHTVGFTENSIGPRTEIIFSWLFKYTQHTAGFTENSIGPRTEIIFSWLFKYTHNTLGFTENIIGPRTEIIFTWLFKSTQQHTAGFTENSIGPRTSIGHCGRHRMVVGFITTYAISVYHH